MYSNWCSSSSKSDLQVGMIIAVSTHSHTSAGRTYGHIGIYIGDGMIMENIGYINAQSVDSWCSYYGTTVTPRWGWIGGASLA
jgi:cell wall-associated NlpC family hydrolase